MRAAIGTLLLLFVEAASAVSPGAEIQTTLEPAGDGKWKVSIGLSEDVSSLVFARGNGDYRKSTWTMGNSGYLLERFGNTDRIRRQDGQSFRDVTAIVDPPAEKLSKDYTPFIPFSDGSVAVFTGQFIVGEPLAEFETDFADGASVSNTRFPDETSFKLKAGAFQQMIVRGEKIGSLSEISADQGEYVYFGLAEAIETSALTAVADPEMPGWLREHLYESMASTFGYYEQRLGPLPAEKPFMLVGYQQLEGGQLSFNGGVIGWQLAIELGLGEAILDSPGERLFMARFFAHEAVHLWNNSRVISPDQADSWMHEGSAEALAWLALRDLGLYDDELTIRLFTDAANACAGYLEDGPLNDAFRREDFRAYYDCGATIALATDGLMAEHGRDLFDFWRTLIEQKESGEREYRAADYRSLAEGFSKEFAAELVTFTTEPQQNGSAVTDLLNAGNVTAVSAADGKIEIIALRPTASGSPGGDPANH